ncbi:mucin-2 isoform X2 [Diachasmimorpha longicaudata]|uniref:mucin-2 isoform X2 n=1 Tax=Diachasmimorpha longicaudata TaxID=58733 RepID=UPI0030B878C2
MDWGLRVTTLALWMVIGLTAINDCNGDQRIICYYTNWSVYRPGTAKYSPQNINPYLCTHLIYAFGGFTKDNTLKPFDKYQDIEKGGYAKFTGLKTYNKNLKTMLAIGGWNEGSSRFSPMVADPERRRELVKNSVKFLRQNHFDGLDLDWEYPAFRDGGKPRDKNNYADLVQELREEFERESSKTGRPRLLLSMAIPAGIEYLEKGYDLPRLNEYLDFFNLLSYDYHSAFEPAVNHHSPLYGLEEANEYNYDSELTIDYTISYLLNHDVTSEKIVLGIPTYGRSYTLYNADATDIGAPADGPGEEGDATREKGYLAYYEICENIAKSDEWEVVQPNEKAMGPYAFRANQWVGYDDENIVRVKAFYVKEKKLGGIMFWSIDNDDFRGKCHGRPYPLIEAAKEALLSGSPKPSERSKPPAHHKKTKSQGSQRTSDTSIERKYSSPRRSGSKPTRKRLSTSRSTPRSTTPTPRIAEDREDSPESSEEHNTLSRPRKTRVKSRSGTRRRDQTRKIDKIEEDASSFSNSITTPEPPTTPDPGSDFKCEDEGFFPHPRDCKKYFWCLDSGPGGLGVVAHQFTCPSGLVFNKAADSCDYPRNVVCPKVKTAPATTTSKPSTTSKTTKKTTTVKPVSEEEEEEEYEYEDDEVNAAEDNEEVPVSTTAKPLLYKTINRSRPTTTTTTTTEATTTEDTIETARGFKGDEGEIEDTEDPKVLKELIDLIKKAGGIEQLEKQLHLQEKTSGDTTEGNLATPATISRSLYERVLNRQATKLFGGATGKDTKQVANSRGSFQNGPGRSQFEGLDEVPEVKSLRRTNKHQYVTIARQRSSTNEPAVSEEELGEEEEVEQDNDDASSDDQVVSNVHEKERNSSPKRVTPNYVNIRRARPTTESSPSEEEPETSSLSTESVEETSQDSTTAKSRYTNIHRFRSTTSSSSEAGNPSKSSEETSESPSTSSLEFTPTEPQVFSTPSPSSTTEIPMTSTESLPDATNPTISTTHQPATEPVKLVENSVTDIPLTTFPAPSNPRTTPLPRTTVSVVSSPRPFGYPRRTRPTTASSSSSSTTTSSTPSTTEQSRLKVSNRPTRNFARSSSSYQNRVRTRTRTSTISNDINQSVENNSNEIASVEPEVQTISRSRLGTRRGGPRYSSRKTTTEIPKSTVSTPDVVSTLKFSSRRGTRPTPTAETTTSSSGISRRRRPTDSKIIRIASDNSEALKHSRSESLGDNDEKITKIRVFKVQEDVLNVIEPLEFENETKNQTESLGTITESISTDSLPTSTASTPTEASTTITETADTNYTTESITTTLSSTTLDNSTVNNEQFTKEDKKQLKRKVLLRRRPVTPSTTPVEPTIEMKRRRKILKRIRPHLETVSNELPTAEDPEVLFSSRYNGNSTTPLIFLSEEKTESTGLPTESSENEITTALIDNLTTNFDNFEDTTVESTTMLTGPNDVTTITIETTLETERPSDNDNLLEPTITTTELDLDEPTTITTTSPTTTPVNLEIPEKPDLPTLKQLIDTNYGITRSFDTSVRSTQTYEVNSLNDEFENKLPHIIDSDGIKVRVKILDDYGSGEVKINQFAVLTLPHGALNPNITSTVLKIEVINDQNVGHLSADDAEILDNRLSRRRVSDNNIINESSPRSSRRRGKVDQHLTTTNWTNSRRRNVRRRGNSITHTDQHAQNTEIVNISSTSPMNEHIVTTVKPTTLRGSSVVIHNSDDPVRGFFITRSLDDVPVVTDKINLAEYTTEMASTITADVMPTTIENDEVTTQFFTTESSHLWNNELDGTKLTTAAETTTTRLFDNYLTTTFQPTEMVLTPGVIEGHEGTTIRSEITTYTNDVNDGQGNNTETTTFREEQLNESNVTVEESTEAPTTTENNYEAVASTTPYSLMTDTNKINESSEKILPDVDGTTSKINDMEEGTTETPDIISTGSLADIIDRTPENRSTIILKIIPFVQDERTDSLSKLQNPTTEVIPSVTHLNPGDVQSSIASSTIPYASTHVTSPSIVSTSYSSINTVSTPPTTTSPPTPEIPLKRFRTNARTRGRVRYYPSSSSITSAPTERKPRPFLSIRRRPYTPRSRLESSESSEESLSITASSQSTTPVPPPPSPKGRIIRRGRGRGRTRQTTSTTTEQSFPSTEVPEEALKIEEDNPNNEATPKYPQAEITKEDDQIIAESSYAEVLGEVGGPRHSGSFLKRPGTIAKPTTLKSYAIEYETADRRYSSKFVVPTTENTDQTGRAQELAVSLIDPSVAASFETAMKELNVSSFN